MSKQIRNRCLAVLLCLSVALAVMVPSFVSLAAVVGAKNRAVLVADMTENAGTEGFSHDQFGATVYTDNWRAVHVASKVQDLSDKTYLYFHFGKQVGKKTHLQDIGLIRRDPWQGAMAQNYEVKTAVGNSWSDWTAVNDAGYDMAEDVREVWARVKLSKLVYNDGTEHAYDLKNVDAVRIAVNPVNDTQDYRGFLTIGNVYAANRDVDVPGVVTPVEPINQGKAVLLRDAASTKEIETSLPLTKDAEGRTVLELTPAESESYNNYATLEMDTPYFGNKEYFYFSVDKNGDKIDDWTLQPSLWIGMQPVASGNAWFGGFDLTDWEINAGDGWTSLTSTGDDLLLLNGHDFLNGRIWFRHKAYGTVGGNIAKMQFKFMKWHKATVTIGNIYAADSDAEIPELANPEAVVLRDMGASSADWDNANGLTLALTNGRLNVNVPQNSGENNAEFILPMTNIDTVGKKYIYFSIDKPSTQDDAQKIWLNVFQAVNEKNWWAEVHSQLEVNDGTGWKTGNSITANTVGGRFWFRWKIGAGVDDSTFFMKNQITKLQFKFASWTAADFSIGNIYAANEDAEIPELSAKALVVADMTNGNQLQANQLSNPSYDANGMTVIAANGSDGWDYGAVQKYVAVKNISDKQYVYYHVTKEAGKKTDVAVQLYGDDQWAGWTNYIPSQVDVKLNGADWATVEGNKITMSEDVTDVWIRASRASFGDVDLTKLSKVRFYFDNTGCDQWDGPRVTIGNVYAANADEDVPGLGLKPAGYTATFVNGDKAVAAAQGETVTAPDAVAIDGFQFVGWADADDYSKVYKAGSTITLTEDTTFVAAGISLETLNSASIRWSADDAKRGLRFTNVVRSNLGGAKETGELVSPALVKTAIKDLGNNQLKDVLNSSTAGGNSRWASESTVTDLCWHGSVTKFAGKGDEVLEHKFSAWAVAEIKYQDGSSGWFTSKATDGFSMKDVAVALKDANTDTSAANYDYINRILKEVYNVG